MWWIFLVAYSCRFPTPENSLKTSHQNFTTFCTLKFTINKEICHLVFTLGAISRKFAFNIVIIYRVHGICYTFNLIPQAILNFQPNVMEKQPNVQCFAKWPFFRAEAARFARIGPFCTKRTNCFARSSHPQCSTFMMILPCRRVTIRPARHSQRPSGKICFSGGVLSGLLGL